MNERRVNPEHQLGVGGGIACPGWEAAEPSRSRPRNLSVHRTHDLARPLRLGLRPKGDQVERAQGSHQPSPEVVLEIGMLNDPRRDEWVRDLKEHRRAATEEWRHR